MKKALIVLEKEWLELRLQPTLLLATMILPPLITAFAVAAFFAVGKVSSGVTLPSTPLPPEFASLSMLEVGQALVGRQFSIVFLLLPIFIPSVLASYAIVGEKRERTLEPVLATPIRTRELLLGKILAALIPALGVIFGIWGLALALPLMAVVKVAIEFLREDRESKPQALPSS